MEVSGPTLTLRYATAADVARLFELGSDAEVTRHFSWGPYERAAQARAYVDELPARRERGELLDFVIDHRTDGVIGVTGLTEHSRRDRRAVVGTWLGRPWWGSGANRESKALLASLAFAGLGLERLGAYAGTSNLRSQRALERLGFRREGELRAWHRHGEQVHDVYVYGLLRDEWERGPLGTVAAAIHGTPPAAYRP